MKTYSLTFHEDQFHRVWLQMVRSEKGDTIFKLVSEPSQEVMKTGIGEKRVVFMGLAELKWVIGDCKTESNHMKTLLDEWKRAPDPSLLVLKQSNVDDEQHTIRMHKYVHDKLIQAARCLLDIYS